MRQSKEEIVEKLVEKSAENLNDTYYIGIDPSITNTGVVVLDSKGTLIDKFNSSSVRCDKNIHGYIYEYDTKSSAIANFLSSYSTKNFVAYENYSFGSIHRAYSLAEFGGILKNKLRAITNNAVMYVAPTEVKKFASSSGTATKEIMKQYAISEEPSLKNETADVCDAYFIAKMAWYKQDTDNAIKYEKSKNLIRNRLEVSIKWKSLQ